MVKAKKSKVIVESSPVLTVDSLQKQAGESISLVGSLETLYPNEKLTDEQKQEWNSAYITLLQLHGSLSILLDKMRPEFGGKARRSNIGMGEREVF